MPAEEGIILDDSLGSEEAADEHQQSQDGAIIIINNEKRKRSRGERAKSTMACIQCRASKLKCDGNRPRCIRCHRLDQICAWVKADGRSSKAKRGNSHASTSTTLPVQAVEYPASHLTQHPGGQTSKQSSRLFHDPRLWWESSLSSVAAPAPPPPPALSDYDWSTLGLEPQDLTQEVLDTLNGQIAWIDQPGNHTMEDMHDSSAQLDGNDAQVVRIQYFRLLGSTGISPGIKKISMEFRLTPLIQKVLFDSTSPPTLQGRRQKLNWDRILSMDQTVAEQDEASNNEEEDDMFEGDIPSPWVLDELLPIFFNRFGDHYLCLNREGLERRLLESGQRIPPMLINIMCALAARYSKDKRITANREVEQSHSFGIIFANKAKLFLVLAWHEFGCNLDSAFWMYAGMALRMAIDLGIHRQSTFHTRDLNDIDFIDDALLFWAVYQMDRVLAMGTGRPTNIKDREITCSDPSIDVEPFFCSSYQAYTSSR